jgi:DNA-binding CsgD family transcriptional regulator
MINKRSLNQSELKILPMLAIGLPNPAIAQELGLSRRTIESHIQNMLQKLGVLNRTMIAALYWTGHIDGVEVDNGAIDRLLELIYKPSALQRSHQDVFE